MEDNELRELLEAAQNGDDTAMADLLEMFKPIIFKNCMIDSKFDEDCFQELSLKFIKCIKNFKFDRKIDIYSYLKEQI